MIHFIQYLFHTFLNWVGASNPAGTTYGFWSGFGSDLGEFAIIVGGITVYKHHNCAVPRCPRIARKHWQVKGTPLRTCHKHATTAWHKILLKQYKEDYKEQHKLFNS